MTKDVDPSICPLCGKGNFCVMTQDLTDGESGRSMKACWCMSASFPENYQSYLAQQDLDKRCICESCLDQMNAGKA
ncbi:cysteine-rich CWC family protein [Litoribrevibacter euphylliae]|uniref:Cysteine-rich CWC family protein n=1 Tax=Litoribrevibacter euphylliae TaxID=1834034 RepID=A0ABV7HC95_9GAMM